MNKTGNFKVTASGDREIVITRDFQAPRARVFEAFATPALVKQWLSGPPGWTMTACDIDLRPGGSFRYEWKDVSGGVMGMGGVYSEVSPPERVVATEKFDEAWYPGEAVGTMTFTERAGITTLTQTIRYESREARDAVLQTPMEQGVAAGYARLAELVESTGMQRGARG